MLTQDFNFDLPDELIAQYPLPNRSDSRLLAYSRQTDTCRHHVFRDLPGLLQPGDLLVMNNSKVIPARFYGSKATGGKIECLVERKIDDRQFMAHIRASKAPKPGSKLLFDKGWSVIVLSKEDDLYRCEAQGSLDELLAEIGHMPLPLYITRADEGADLERYQTVYAEPKGSVAAPTAGLHFDESLLQALHAQGINTAFVTLHVGAGTFRPVRCANITDHKMHAEQFIVSEEVAEAVNRTKAAGKRVIAVGTTALRSLESAALDGQLEPCRRDTDIFIYPGYRFKLCDGLITNFHLPESTLLMLVSAFIGQKTALSLYQEAIAHRYRFYSYGDATLLL